MQEMDKALELLKTVVRHDMKKTAHLMNEIHALMCKTIADCDQVGKYLAEHKSADSRT